MFRNNKPQKDITCKNCNYPLPNDENLCPYCGQKNDIRRLSIKNYFKSFLGNFFNFDSKIWFTIIQLFKNPGKVPLEYIRGKRASYNNPFRLIIQVSIIYFLWLSFNSFLGINTTNFITVTKSNELPEKVDTTDYAKLIDSINNEINFIQQLKQANSKEKRDSLSKIALKATNKDKTSLGIDHGIFTFYTPDTLIDTYNDYLNKHDIDYSYFIKHDLQSFEAGSFWEKINGNFMLIANRPYVNLNEREIIDTLGIKKSFLNRLSVIIPYRLHQLIKSDNAREQYKKNLLSKITIALFFVLPLFSFFNWLLYYKSGYNYTENLVFVFYMQSLYFVIISLELLPYIGVFLGLISAFIFLFYLIIAYRQFYKTKPVLNFFKVVFLIVPLYTLIAVIGLLGVSFITLIV